MDRYAVATMPVSAAIQLNTGDTDIGLISH